MWYPGAIATKGCLLSCLVVLSHHPEWDHFNKKEQSFPPSCYVTPPAPPNISPERHSSEAPLYSRTPLQPETPALPLPGTWRGDNLEGDRACHVSFSHQYRVGSKQPAPPASSLEPSLSLGTQRWLHSFLSEREGARMAPTGQWGQSPQRVSNASSPPPPPVLNSVRQNPQSQLWGPLKSSHLLSAKAL